MTPRRLPQPPVPFPAINRHTLPTGSLLHRNHARSFAPDQFNPCRGQPTRFAPFTDAVGQCVPSLYAATSREAAAFETVFHDIDPKASFRTVPLSVVAARSVSRIAPRRDLTLAALFAPDLKAWGIARTELIETPKSTYGQTVAWARAIHHAHRDIDGLIWTSRQCDPERCVILFGDRVAASALGTIDRLQVSEDAGLLLEVRGYARRIGVELAA